MGNGWEMGFTPSPFQNLYLESNRPFAALSLTATNTTK